MNSRRSFVCASALVVSATAMALGGGPAGSALSPRYVLRKMATADNPVGVYVAPGSTTVLVAEQTGRIRPITPTGLGPPALDVSADISGTGERGLLGVAWSRTADRLYVDLTNTAGDTEIREYAWVNDRADPATKRLLLTIKQPYANHNGGQLVVDSSGLLWIGMGDGGSAGDPENRAQNPKELLGKILRIDPTPSATAPYSIPPDNPYASGVAGRPEIWALGLRNPWRFTIDESAKRLIVGDVGQDDWEEIDAVALSKAGANLGWRLREGRHPFNDGDRPPGVVEPVFEYSHANGCSVTGGVVYRGKALPELLGRYLFGDYCKGQIGALTPGPTQWRHQALGITQQQLTSFGVDSTGEVWLTSGDGVVSKLVRSA